MSVDRQPVTVAVVACSEPSGSLEATAMNFTTAEHLPAKSSPLLTNMVLI